MQAKAEARDLEEMERLPPTQFGGGQDVMRQRLGERVMARTFERQVTELHVRVALLSRSTHRQRRLCRCLLWRSYVWGWGDLGLIRVCATKPARTQEIDGQGQRHGVLPTPLPPKTRKPL